ncbi:MAG: TIM barrel protein [Armatimonadota bacterium]|nr:TIM barrel protein [Armatimonadota bacterium]
MKRRQFFERVGFVWLGLNWKKGERGMEAFRQDLCWWCFGGSGVDPLKFIREAKQIGYQGFELLPREMWDTVRGEGLTIVTHGGHGTIADGLNRKENHSRIEEEILANLELAKVYEIPILICFSGNRRGLSDEEGIDNTVEGLLRVAKKAEEAGVTLALEVLNSKVDHKDYQADRTWWAVEVCKRVNSPRVRVLYDIYHMQIMEGDVIRTIQENFEWMAHFHTAGNPGRRDLDDEQELNYRGIMRAIARLGYKGFVGQEFIPKGDPVEAIRRAYEICRVDT